MFAFVGQFEALTNSLTKRSAAYNLSRMSIEHKSTKVPFPSNSSRCFPPRQNSKVFLLLILFRADQKHFLYRNMSKKTCPICQADLNSTDDTWVLSELPAAEEISEKICTELMALSKEQ